VEGGSAEKAGASVQRGRLAEKGIAREMHPGLQSQAFFSCSIPSTMSKTRGVQEMILHGFEELFSQTSGTDDSVFYRTVS
jgi:hypothetical protein